MRRRFQALKSMDRAEVQRIVRRVSRYFAHPSSLDSDDALTNAYMETFQKKGQIEARLEVARRIKAAKEIRKLKEMWRK